MERYEKDAPNSAPICRVIASSTLVVMYKRFYASLASGTRPRAQAGPRDRRQAGQAIVTAGSR